MSPVYCQHMNAGRCSECELDTLRTQLAEVKRVDDEQMAHLRAQLTAANARADAAEAKLAIQSVLLEVVDERIRQDKQWGGPEHDDDHTCEDWTWYIDKQRIRAKVSGGSANFRKAMVKIAALAVAAIQSYDRIAAAKVPR